MAHMAADPVKPFDLVVEEDAALEKLGYQQGKMSRIRCQLV